MTVLWSETAPFNKECRFDGPWCHNIPWRYFTQLFAFFRFSSDGDFLLLLFRFSYGGDFLLLLFRFSCSYFLQLIFINFVALLVLGVYRA